MPIYGDSKSSSFKRGATMTILLTTTRIGDQQLKPYVIEWNGLHVLVVITTSSLIGDQQLKPYVTDRCGLRVIATSTLIGDRQLKLGINMVRY